MGIVAILPDDDMPGDRLVIAADPDWMVIRLAHERVLPERTPCPDARRILYRHDIELLPDELMFVAAHAEIAIAACEGRLFAVDTTTQPCPTCGAEVPCGDVRGEIADCPACSARLFVGKSGLEWRRSDVVR